MVSKKNKENKEKDEQTRREEYDKQTNRKNIGEGRKISNPYGSSRTSQEFRESQIKERKAELENIEKLGVVSDGKKGIKKK